MYLCRKSWKGLLLHTKLWAKLETSRLSSSFYRRMLGPVFLFLLSQGEIRSLAPMFSLVQETCLPYLSMVCAFTHVSLRHPEFFFTNRSHETSESAQQNRI